MSDNENTTCDSSDPEMIPVDYDDVDDVLDDNSRHGSQMLSDSYIQNTRTYKSANSFDSFHNRTSKSAGSGVLSIFSVDGDSVVMEVENSVLKLVSEIQNGEIDASTEGGEGERKSQLCCFFLCDLVKAKVIADALFIVLVLFYLLISYFPESRIAERMGMVPLHVDNGDRMNGNDDFVDDNGIIDPWLVVGYVKLSSAIVFCSIGIFGALKFNKSLVLVSAVWYVCYAILNIADWENRRWIGTFMALAFSYPSWHLFVALHNKTIQKENYSNEKYCCCCPSGEQH